jgi:hypothetical protein
MIKLKAREKVVRFVAWVIRMVATWRIPMPPPIIRFLMVLLGLVMMWDDSPETSGLREAMVMAGIFLRDRTSPDTGVQGGLNRGLILKRARRRIVVDGYFD